MALSEELNKHTVVELKAMLTEKGLPVTGKKAELVDRLIEAETGVPQVAGVTITREADKGAEVPAPSVPGEQTSETTMTSIPNEDGKTTEVDLTSDKAAPPTTLVELGVGAEKSPAEIELEKRRARAAKFGIPFVEPAASAPKATPASTSKPESKKASNAGEEKKKAVATPASTPAPSAASLAESEEALAKRRAKWGVVEKPGAMQKVKGKLVEKTEAVKAAVSGPEETKTETAPQAQTAAPVEKTAEQVEEERRRKAREDRFKTASSAPESTNGEGETGGEKRKLDEGVEVQETEEPAEKKVKV